MDYAAPGENKDDRHRVGVRFKEAGAPFVWLEITAQVREPLTVTPPEVIFGQAGKSRSLEKTFEIQNFTEVDCHLLSVRANSPWLAVRQAEFAAASNKGGQPRQVWRILVKAQTRELAFGKNHAQIEIETDHPEVPHRSVPVTLDVASPVAVVPSQLFFGDIEASPPSSHKVLLRFSPDAIPARAEDILVSHDLGDRLSLACVRTTQNCYWELVATLTPSRGGPEDKVIQGTVAVSFANQELPTLRVPVYARMR